MATVEQYAERYRIDYRGDADLLRDHYRKLVAEYKTTTDGIQRLTLGRLIEAVAIVGREVAGSATPSVSSQPAEKCERCSGSGVYRWGTITNGKAAHEGPCYRCGGKGVQTEADRRRNYGYDNYHMRVAV